MHVFMAVASCSAQHGHVTRCQVLASEGSWYRPRLRAFAQAFTAKRSIWHKPLTCIHVATAVAVAMSSSSPVFWTAPCVVMGSSLPRDWLRASSTLPKVYAGLLVAAAVMVRWVRPAIDQADGYKRASPCRVLIPRFHGECTYLWWLRCVVYS